MPAKAGIQENQVFACGYASWIRVSRCSPGMTEYVVFAILRKVGVQGAVPLRNVLSSLRWIPFQYSLGFQLLYLFRRVRKVRTQDLFIVFPQRCGLQWQFFWKLGES